MILIYAYGSGLGHLKRVNDFLTQEKYNPQNCLILTNSTYSAHWGNSCKIIFKENSFFSLKEEFFNFFQELCFEYRVEEIIVDVFPAGFNGELTEFLAEFKGKKTLLARILKEKYFIKNSEKPTFDQIYLMEKGVQDSDYSFEKAEEYFLKPLMIPSAPGTQKLDYFLLIHSQPLSEVLHLYALAKMYRNGQKIIIQTMVEIPKNNLDLNTEVILSENTNENLIENAELIFSGAGFNTVKELLPYRKKWKCTPFPRTYDDQFLRKKLNA